MKKVVISPYICLNDFEYMDNYSKGWHSYGAERIEVEKLSIGYPVADWSEGEVRSFPVEKKAYTVGELFRAINDVVVAEIDKGNNYAPHVADDYCMERITVLDGVAEVQFGS